MEGRSRHVNECVPLTETGRDETKGTGEGWH